MPATRPSNSSPILSARCSAISRSTVSRSALTARRSAVEISGDLAQLVFRHVRQAVLAVAEIERPDQRAMHDQVGIAADRRGEMRVAQQVETEMAVVLGRVFACAWLRRITSLTMPRGRCA
jgi:hypothetical protein